MGSHREFSAEEGGRRGVGRGGDGKEEGGPREANESVFPGFFFGLLCV